MSDPAPPLPAPPPPAPTPPVTTSFPATSPTDPVPASNPAPADPAFPDPVPSAPASGVPEHYTLALEGMTLDAGLMQDADPVLRELGLEELRFRFLPAPEGN